MPLSPSPSLDAPVTTVSPAVEPVPAPSTPTSAPHDQVLDLPVKELTIALEELNRAQREVSARLSRELDFPRASLGALRLLQRCGPLQVTELAHHLKVDLSVASRQVTHLVDAGLVERTACDDDRRARSVTLTPEGRTKVDETFHLLLSRTAETFAGWTADDLLASIHQLGRLTEALSRA
ncbi:MarR family winged helix-turn-helix transcriptional regulator [Oerskovia turbata]|uniref:MarR family winged helix-turn-helix transcriptional regulator n=1 Tax=Oerskovia turbata TaxID=1713 RepID=UPI000AAE9C75|nr:MarR family winged helix-turn-helix transcriptional regulator [Oerskovia turbata]TGJ96381.1 MarR family transcriptional regulator [Actinotalea fermentans ATCC 43279 = JCM 9966 = DSM 3133]